MIFSFDVQNNRPVVVLMFVVPYRKLHGMLCGLDMNLRFCNCKSLSTCAPGRLVISPMSKTTLNASVNIADMQQCM